MFGVTPTHQAASEGQTEALKVLIEAGADVNQAPDDGRTPVDVATTTEILYLLVQAGAETTKKNVDLVDALSEELQGNWTYDAATGESQCVCQVGRVFVTSTYTCSKECDSDNFPRVKRGRDDDGVTNTDPCHQCQICVEHCPDCVIACGHAFCAHCLVGLQQRGTHTCPLCRKDFWSIQSSPKGKIHNYDTAQTCRAERRRVRMPPPKAASSKGEARKRSRKSVPPPPFARSSRVGLLRF